MAATDQRVIDNLYAMNTHLKEIQAKVNEMSVYMKSIAESLQILARRGMVVKT